MERTVKVEITPRLPLEDGEILADELSDLMYEAELGKVIGSYEEDGTITFDYRYYKTLEDSEIRENFAEAVELCKASSEDYFPRIAEIRDKYGEIGIKVISITRH